MVTNRMNRYSLGVAALAAALTSSMALAQEAKPVEHPVKGGAIHEHVPVNSGGVTINGGVSFTTDYFFRGIGQENQGLLIQPEGYVSFKLTDQLTLTTGAWSSLHNGPTGTQDIPDGSRQDPQSWYEADFVAGLSLALDKVTLSTTYTAYMSPNDSFQTVQEIAVRAGFNDSEMLNLQPYVLVAFELDDQADSGNSVTGLTGRDEGIYMELGVTPSFVAIPSETTPVTLYFPIVAGFSLDNYYESNQDGADDDFFGYVSLGVTADMPLSFVPAKFGTWKFVVGVSVLFLGDTADDLSSFNGTGHDEVHVIGKIGLTFAY